MPDAADFLVRRDDLRQTRLDVRDAHGFEPAPGEALLRVDHFAFTANNVTYAVAGDLLSYWKFFPAPEGWGRIPVWGFGDVVASSCPGVREGARYYGYYPMSTHLLVQPQGVRANGFRDGAPHRNALPAIYNRYSDVSAEPGYSSEREALQMLFQPLFGTAFLIDDFLAESHFFGARRVVLASASSKTAFATAFQLAQREGLEIVGFSSPANQKFVENLGCYARVLPYDDVGALDPEPATVFIDMAGSAPLRSAVHQHLGPSLRHSMIVGSTHWEERGPSADLPGVAPAFFFAPTRLEKRTADWGAAGLQERLGHALTAFGALAERAVRVVRGGRGDVEPVYRRVLEGRSPPDEGLILSLL